MDIIGGDKLDLYPFYLPMSNKWDSRRKQDLIQSIYNGYMIGFFVFIENPHKSAVISDVSLSKYEYECINGANRLQAIVSFIKNEYPDKEGRYFKDLCSEDKKYFMNFDNILFTTFRTKYISLKIKIYHATRNY